MTSVSLKGGKQEEKTSTLLLSGAILISGAPWKLPMALLFLGTSSSLCVLVTLCVCALARAQPLSLVNSMRPMGCSPPGSSVHGILHARILERVAVPSSRGSSRSRDRTRLSCIAGGFFTAHGILQARTLEWGEALTPSRISSGRAVTGNRSIASRGRLDLSQSRQWPD